jgi:hypothetical protein
MMTGTVGAALSALSTICVSSTAFRAGELGLAQRIEDSRRRAARRAGAQLFRIAPVLETGAERYAWLNNMRFPPNMV